MGLPLGRKQLCFFFPQKFLHIFPLFPWIGFWIVGIPFDIFNKYFIYLFFGRGGVELLMDPSFVLLFNFVFLLELLFSTLVFFALFGLEADSRESNSFQSPNWDLVFFTSIIPELPIL